MTIQLLYFDGCPHWQVTHERLEEVLAEQADPPPVELVLVNSPEEAERLGFRGSPSILVDGRDPFASADEPVGLSCRLYETPAGQAGSPTLEQLRAVVGR